MAIDQFVPELWSARYLRHLDAALRYAQPGIINRNWEGQIAQAGDTVHIFQVADPTVKTYTPGTDMDAPERPDGTTKVLTVDKFRYFNIAIDDVNRRQAMGIFDQYSQRAARQMRETVDADTGAVMVAGAGVSVGTDAAPVTVKADGTGDYTPYQFFVELGKALDDEDAPEQDRWVVVNPALKAEIVQDNKYVDAGGAITRNGQIGDIAGFTVVMTTSVPTSPGSGGAPVANDKIVAGAGDYATTFANQLTENEAYRIERQFGDGWKGLEVWGSKVVEPETLAVGHVTQ